MLQSKMFDFADAALESVSEEVDFKSFFSAILQEFAKIAGVAKVLEIVSLSLRQSFFVGRHAIYSRSSECAILSHAIH